MRVDLEAPKTFRVVLTEADVQLLERGMQLIVKVAGVMFVVEREEVEQEKADN